MENSQITEQIKTTFDNSKNILIAIKKNPSLDSVAGALALYAGFVKSQKSVTIACETSLTVEFGNLFSVDKILTSLGGNNMIISFDYTEGAIEKVSYNVENNKFNLIIQPKEGQKPPLKDKIDFSYSGANFDSVFIVDCDSFNDLGNLYTQEQKLYSEKPTINVNYKQDNPAFATINVHDFNSSSASETVAKLLKTLGIAFEQDLATNILTGIMTQTGNLQKAQFTADLFEIIAACLRSGGKMPQGAVVPTQQTFVQPQQPVVQQPVQQIPQQPVQTPKAPSPDWLTPKIYKGSSLV